MNMNEECLLKYLQNPDELFNLNDMLSDIDTNHAGVSDETLMPDYMLQHIY